MFLPYDKNGQNPAQRPKNGPPSDQTATYRKTEGIQSYLRIWGTYDPIESAQSDPKKWGLYGCNVKNADFRAKNAFFLAQNQFVSDIDQKLCYHHDWTLRLYNPHFFGSYGPDSMGS